MPKLSQIFNGRKPKIKQKSTLSPQQQELMSLINEGLTIGSGPFASLFGDFDKEAFEEGVTKPALANFEENILPKLQEKFIAGNQVLGSGFRNAQLKEASKLQTQLAALMYDAQQNQQKNKLAGIQNLLGTRAVENIYRPGQQGAFQGFITGAAESLGQSAGSALFGNGGSGGGVGNNGAAAANAAAAIAG